MVNICSWTNAMVDWSWVVQWNVKWTERATWWFDGLLLVMGWRMW